MFHVVAYLYLQHRTLAVKRIWNMETALWWCLTWMISNEYACWFYRWNWSCICLPSDYFSWGLGMMQSVEIAASLVRHNLCIYFIYERLDCNRSAISFLSCLWLNTRLKTLFPLLSIFVRVMGIILDFVNSPFPMVVLVVIVICLLLVFSVLSYSQFVKLFRKTVNVWIWLQVKLFAWFISDSLRLTLSCIFFLYLLSINTVYYMAPLATMILGLPAILVEGSGVINWFYTHEDVWSALIIILCSGLLAFCLNFSIFYVIHSTTAVTFNVAGNLKVRPKILIP